MKTGKCLLAGLLMAALSVLAWAQGYSARASGTVTKNGTPVDNVQVVFSIPEMGKQYKTKTDKRGNFFSTGMGYGNYKLQVIGAGGEVLFTRTDLLIDREEIPPLNIDLANPAASYGVAGDSSGGKQPAAPPKMTKEQQKAEAARVKAENEKLASMNELITKYQASSQAGNWPEAEKALEQLLAADPNTTRWEVYQRLADAQDHNNEQADALRNLDKGIALAQAIISGKAPKDPHNPNQDPGRAKIGISQMLVTEGTIYTKMGNAELAAPLFAQAAQDNPNPALAYYNLCVTQFNASKWDDAVSACDKSLASDPSHAEAWFLKGSALYKSGKAESSKSAVEALNKYLELDPNGQHANDAKTILKAAGQK
jgi:tetratricopeptide (TPR) repeat protein